MFFIYFYVLYIINLNYSVKGLLHICTEMTELSKVGEKKEGEENISQPFLQSFCGLVLIVHAAN